MKRLMLGGALGLTLIVFALFAPPWMRQWGSTPQERSRAMPGDSILLPRGLAATETRAIDVRAPASITWEWLRRMGQGRGGFYSYEWLENLFGDDVHNRRDLFPAPPLAVGDTIKLTQDRYPAARPGLTALPIAAVAPGRWFVLKGWGTFVVESVGPARSRIIVRERPPAATGMVEAAMRGLVWEPMHFVMERQMLRGLRDRAEGAPAPTFETIVASAGLVLGGLGFAGVMVRRRRWGWLVAPSAVALLAIAVTGGVQAALAGFVALGVPGVIWTALPRDRWLTLTALVGAVLLLLVAAPDAYVVIGWTVGLVTGGWFFWRQVHGDQRLALTFR